MSPKNTLLTAGLTALGYFGIVGLSAAVPGDPPAPTGFPPVAASPNAAAPATAPATSNTVLLLSNGNVIHGAIHREGNDYVIRQRAGTIRFPQSQVEKACDSIAELYEYRRSLIPPDDPDEHLKLARWCLSQNLQTEAKAELQAVVAVSPKSGAAKAMLGMIEAREARASQPQVDADLVQTVAEGDTSMSQGRARRPEELNAAQLRRAQGELRVSGQPVIFDLPPIVAAKRYEQFARAVHPVLQATCARCHNEQHDGKFQLIEVKSRKGLTAGVYRANLDATLQLIDPKNPLQSEILSTVLLPHGGSASKRPIFRGSNDPSFKIIAAWVNSLRPVRPTDALTQTRFGGPTRETTGGGFASERGAAPLPFTPTPTTLPVTGVDPDEKVPGEVGTRKLDFGPVNVVPSSRYVPGKGMVVEKSLPSAGEFPVSPLAGGPMPKSNGAPGLPAPPATPPGTPKGDISAGTPLPPGILPDYPAGSAGPPASSHAKSPTTAGTSKKVKIDPSLLEKALMNRNAPR